MIRVERILEDIEAIASIAEYPNGGVNRPAFSPADEAAHRYLASQMTAIGLSVRFDAAGNLFGRRTPDVSSAETKESDSLPTLLIGSHLDSIPGGGKYDGVLGVVAALESLRAFDEARLKTPYPIEIVAFRDEEERFLGYFGSLAMTGQLENGEAADTNDSDGVSLHDAMAEAGFDLNDIARSRRAPETLLAFVELHIEQAARLARSDAAIGLVTQIKGNYRWRVTIEGQTDHAGAPKVGRRDAFMAAMHAITTLRDFCRTQDESDTTCTVGRFDAMPNIETTQPGHVAFSLDVRSPDATVLEDAKRLLTATLSEIGCGRQVACAGRIVRCEPPTPFDSGVMAAIQTAIDKNGLSSMSLASGAGHDAQIIAPHVPTGMIFVPSVDGRSHCPEEYTPPEDIARGARVLFDTIIHLAHASANEARTV